MQSGSCRFFHEEIEWADAIGLRFDLCFGFPAGETLKDAKPHFISLQ